MINWDYMETAENIVETYCRYVKNWFTISNIKCANHEFDLLAVDLSSPSRIKRYHIETSIHTTGSFAKLTSKPFNSENLRTSKQASERRTIGFFKEKKFEHREVIEELKKYGFENNNYEKVIVSLGWDESVEAIAKKEMITLWDFSNIMKQIILTRKDKKSYSDNDFIRIIQFLRTSKMLKDLE